MLSDNTKKRPAEEEPDFAAVRTTSVVVKASPKRPLRRRILKDVVRQCGRAVISDDALSYSLGLCSLARAAAAKDRHDLVCVHNRREVPRDLPEMGAPSRPRGTRSA